MFEPPDSYEPGPQPKSIQLNSAGDNVVHYVALPNGETTIKDVQFPENPLLNYEFELDQFQKISIACVHNNESVLVSAHTSAGKTAIAYYAVKAAISKGARVVYTSPIKALSNQKYKELKEQFGDVGLITGDISLNQSASILVMTTEVLRMMLYRGDSLIRELYWVIYDEIHYMKDVERGVVWEESIIMLPDQVRFVFLSATIPNAREFSEWIAQIHHQPCHVVYTEYRPVPLKYFLAPTGKDIIQVKEADENVNDGAVFTAFSKVQQVQKNTSRRLFKGLSIHEMISRSKPKVDKESNYRLTCDIANSLVDQKRDPILVFAFSRKDCDELPNSLDGRRFIPEDISESISEMVDATVEKLSDSDKKLPQIERIKSLVVRGIGIHHGGLIPLMKELIELLFQHGLIRILFATETFAMGLNMPAKTVIFHSLNKFDGQKKRMISGGEFIQMSGRAGRRNNDKFGSVVIAINPENDQDDIINLLKEKAQPLNSEFHVSYHMILSLLCTSQAKPEALMSKSFHQFQMERQIPKLKKELDELYGEIEKIEIPNEEKAKIKYELEEQLEHFKSELNKIIYLPENISKFLTKGRLVEVGNEWGWGIITNPPQKKEDVLVLLRGKENATKELVPSKTIEGSSAYIFSIKFSDIINISETIININDQLSGSTMFNLFNRLDKIIASGIHTIDKKDMITIKKDEYDSYAKQINYLTQLLKSLDDVSINSMITYKRKHELQAKASVLREEMQSIKAAVMQQDLNSMRIVLEKLGFTDENGLITEKGRVASCISAGDEIVITEILFNGIMKDMTPQQIAAIMSVFACDAGSKEEPEIPEDLIPQWEELQNIISKVVEVSNESGINITFESYMKNIDATYMILTYNWASGAEFIQLMDDNPDFFEGSVIRTMKRTEEILKQAAIACKQMGNSQLELSILHAIKLIKRDIIFAASLYL